jgi:hypothetical protein
VEEVAHRCPKPPLVEVCDANDIADEGFNSSSLPGMVHSACVAFVTRQRSPSSMSHDAFLSVKVERPHGSVEGARKHSDDNGSGGGANGVSSLSCLLWQIGNASVREAESRGV